ncbi:MAG TPA: ABC transporter permease [Blastocatellia bacterium]|jgi:ABC-2 type transport system permease protein
MKGILAIYRRELGSYFVSPIAYVVIGFFLALTGYFFYDIVGRVIEYSFSMQMRGGQFGAPPGIDAPMLVIRNFAGFVTTILLFLVPMLTMGVYAEERKRGTMEMLMTSPITEFQIVIGKFMASLTLFAVMLAPTVFYHFAISRYTEPAMPWRIMWSGYLGIFLLGASLLALGSFISSLTENQIVAGVVTFVVFLLLWILDFGARDSSTTFGEVMKYISILQHYESFGQGVIDTSSIIFYLSVVAVGLFLTLRNLDSMRWRRA